VNRFISIVLTAMVCLGLMLVPAAMLAAPASGQVGIEAAESGGTSLIRVGLTDSFDVNITVYNPDAVLVQSGGIHMTFDSALLNVTGIDNGDWENTAPFSPWINNTTGDLAHEGYMGVGHYLSSDFLHCTIHVTANGVSGETSLNFSAAAAGPADAFTQILNATGDQLDWNAVQNATVIIGSPNLTVCVNPAGKGSVSAEGTPLVMSSCNVTEWNWDDDVTLLATPVAGWQFFNWSGDLTGSTNPDDVTMDELTKSVTANFVELPPDLDVDPNVVNLTAREGGNEDSGIVTISNDGGGTLCWAVGEPPVWSVGDNWTMWNTYSTLVLPNGTEIPYGNPYYNPNATCTVNDTWLVMAVTGENADYYYALADWPLADPQRTTTTLATACMYDANVTVDKCTLDYVNQHATLSIDPIGSTYADVDWVYDGCHGWPYYAGKTWTYNMTITDVLHPSGIVAAATATVTGPLNPLHPIANGLTDVYQITHWVPQGLPPTDPNATVFMQQFWSDTVRNFVYQWDGGTFYAPPLDIRALVSFNVSAPAAPAPKSWLSFNRTNGACGIGESQDLLVTANSTGLDVGLNSTSFTITGCGSMQQETVDVNFLVTPATTIDVTRDLPADAMDLDAEYPGMTFDVYVNFTSPSTVDDFASIGLTDFAPAGWLVATNNTWCDPVASWNKSNYNKAEYAWSGPSGGYGPSTTFSARYEVTIPATASPGINEWPDCMETCPACGESSSIEDFCAWVEYWFGAEGPFESSICGDYQKIVTVPGCVVGETRDVNADPLDTVLVVLSEEPAEMGDEPEDSDSSTMTMYENCADDTGWYYQVASKYCYYPVNISDGKGYTNYTGGGAGVPYPDYINWTTPELLAAGYTMDFEGDYGLVCRAATMSYAMESINHWLFTPIDEFDVEHPEWQLSSWKALESVYSWRFPNGCNC